MSELLAELRDEIERVNTDILAALNRRTHHVLAIAEEKRRLGMPPIDSEREARLLDLVADRNPGPLDEATIRRIFREILLASVDFVSDPARQAARIRAEDGPVVRVVAASGHVLERGGAAWIAGPPAVRSAAQMDALARGLRELGVGFLQGGVFGRPSSARLGPTGEPALRLLRDVASEHGLAAVCEVMSPAGVELALRYVDVLRVGAESMANADLLRAAGRSGKPVLLERGLSSTVEQWLEAADQIAAAGSSAIVLCAGGIKTFVTDTPSTLDLSAVPLALAASRLPVAVDVGRAAGRADITPALCCAAYSVGASAVSVEVDTPDCPGKGALTPAQLADLVETVSTTLLRVAGSLETTEASPSSSAIRGA